MQIILLERIEKLGVIGAVVNVKDGFARNFLLPRKKAIRATKENISIFEKQRADIEAKNAAKKEEAEALKAKLDNLNISLIRQAAEDGRLFGSVNTKDIANAVKLRSGIHVASEAVLLNMKFKSLGRYDIELQLHPEVKAVVHLSVARTEGELRNPDESAAEA